MNKFIWLIKRELWEWRSAWIAPAALAATLILILLYVAISNHAAIPMEVFDSSSWGTGEDAVTPAKLDVLASLALVAIASLFGSLLFLMRIFYSTDTLYGERRERSILFLKSLPISDMETVLSKVVFVLVVLPVVILGVLLIAQVVIFAIVSVKFASAGALVAHLWQPAVWGDALYFILWMIVAGAVWYLPVVTYYLLVSAASPRLPLLVAILIPLGVGLFETIVVGQHPLTKMFVDRNARFGAHLLSEEPGAKIDITHHAMHLPHSLSSMVHPLDFFTDPATLIGIVVAAGFFAATVWVRRYRDAAG